MKFNIQHYYRFNIILRILVLVLTSLFLFDRLNNSTFSYIEILLGLFLIIQFVSLIRFIEKPNYDLTSNLDAIRYKDFSRNLQLHFKDEYFQELNRALQEVYQMFQNMRIEKEMQYQYLENLVKHVQVGLLAFKANGEIVLFNDMAKEILGIRYLQNFNTLKEKHQNLYDDLIEATKRKQYLISYLHFSSQEQMQVAINTSQFGLKEDTFQLISLQNIKSELDTKEIESWHELIRVLTHEIMNSITPIASLASTANGMINQSVSDQYEESSEKKEQLEDIQKAISTIEKRSQGLLKFIHKYRSLTKLPAPDIAPVSINELLKRISELNAGLIQKANIVFEVQVQPEHLKIEMDIVLIEQVLINLVKNAIEAVSKVDFPKIKILSHINLQGRPIIQIEDNGNGIPKENWDKIFIPFYTTKSGGSGIGLTISKQIMRKHQGAIQVFSESGKSTVFTLLFK